MANPKDDGRGRAGTKRKMDLQPTSRTDWKKTENTAAGNRNEEWGVAYSHDWSQ